MSISLRLSVLAFLSFFAVDAANGQVRAGGAAAGIGRAFEASGRSAAAKGLQRKMNSTLLRAIAKEKASRRSTAAPLRTGSATPAPAIEAPPVIPDSSATFKPDPNSTYINSLADELGTNATERAQLRQLFAATKEAFEKEVASQGRANNIAAAFTFFIASTVTVYRDDPEPSDAAIDRLWDGMSSALAETPEVANLTNDEKQQMYDLLIALSGFVLAGHMESKNSGDKASQAIFKQLAGALIESVLKTDPAKLRFTKDGLDIVS